jgi:hypothetical protein
MEYTYVEDRIIIVIIMGFIVIVIIAVIIILIQCHNFNLALHTSINLHLRGCCGQYLSIIILLHR